MSAYRITLMGCEPTLHVDPRSRRDLLWAIDHERRDRLDNGWIQIGSPAHGEWFLADAIVHVQEVG